MYRRYGDENGNEVESVHFTNLSILWLYLYLWYYYILEKFLLFYINYEVKLLY